MDKAPLFDKRVVSALKGVEWKAPKIDDYLAAMKSDPLRRFVAIQCEGLTTTQCIVKRRELASALSTTVGLALAIDGAESGPLKVDRHLLGEEIAKASGYVEQLAEFLEAVSDHPAAGSGSAGVPIRSTLPALQGLAISLHSVADSLLSRNPSSPGGRPVQSKADRLVEAAVERWIAARLPRRRSRPTTEAGRKKAATEHKELIALKRKCVVAVVAMVFRNPPQRRGG